MLAEAMADLDAALRLDSKISAAYRIRAVIYEEYGDFNRALADYDEAIRVEPSQFHALLVAWAVLRKTQRSRPRLGRLFARHRPQADEQWPARRLPLRHALGNLCEEAESKLALADIETSIANETSKAYLQTLHEKRDRLERAVAPSYVESGQAATAAGDMKRAIADFSEAIRLDGNLFQAYFGRALAYDKTGDTDRALADVSTAVSRNEKSIEARTLRAELQIRKSNFKNALDDLEAAFKLGLKFEWEPYPGATVRGDRPQSSEREGLHRPGLDLSHARRYRPRAQRSDHGDQIR